MGKNQLGMGKGYKPGEREQTNINTDLTNKPKHTTTLHDLAWHRGETDCAK